ncbi:GH32 C-terminal domain-containing protein [Mesobacillus thioparans]|uniref:GH32 C-terminal domain-containing protein n=1 Tax=Mesobacillus thioparans TaxID=370439 RepID=UPI0039EDF020
MSLIYNLEFNEGYGSKTKERVRGTFLCINYVLNDAKYKSTCTPRWAKSNASGYALDFDGYSTFIKDEALVHDGAFTISSLVAPRCFEACHGEVSTAIIDQLDRENNRGFALSLFQHGEVQFEMGDGEKIHLLRTRQQLELYKKSLITVTYSKGKIELFINSKLQMIKEVDWAFVPSDIPLSIGISNTPFHISKIFKGGMFSGLIDYIKVFNENLSEEEIQREFYELEGKLQLDLKDIDLDETLLLDDIHRPQYHAIPPQHWMNEPHAPFYYNGKYHLFYQKNASGPYFSNLHWGHWTSEDMVFWQNEKTALFPQKGDVSPSGVWSGSATIGPQGIPYLFYTFADFSKKFNQGVAIATPKDIEDPNLIEWVMEDKVAIMQTDRQGIRSQFRDPFVWKDPAKDIWYLIIGGGIDEKGPTAWIYTSIDCENWEFKGEFFTVDKAEYPYLGTNWELPVFLPVSDAKGNTKHVFIFMSFFHTESRYHVDTYYYIGDFDKDNFRFVPDSEEPQLIDYGKFKFSGPSGFVDPVTGKSIVFSILQGDRNEQEEYDAGWAHNAGLPIELYLENNELRMRPLENLTSLRDALLLDEANLTLSEINQKIEKINHKMLEVLVEFEEVDGIVGLELKKNLNEHEKTLLIYDEENNQVRLDRRKSRLGREGDIQGGPLDVGKDFSVQLFLDHSTIECFMNNKKTITSRAYPLLSDSDHISLIGDQGTKIRSIKIYKLKPIWKRGETSDYYDNRH